MSSDWSRPHYKPSPSRPSLFYLVFGEPPASDALNISRVRHHVDRVQPELQVSRHPRGQDPAWFDAWLSSAVGSDIGPVFGDGAAAVFAAQHVTAVRGEFDDPDSLAYLRNTVGVVSAVTEAAAPVAILDADSLTWWKPQDWRRRFVDESEFRIDDHVFIAVTDDPQAWPGLRTYTRGMRKFGRPELEIRHLPGEYAGTNPAIRDSGRILSGLANHLARGAVIEDGRTMYLAAYESTIVFFESHGKAHSLEVCDINPDTGISSDGASHLLERMRVAGPGPRE